MKFPVVSNFLCCQFINYVNNFDLFVTLVLPMVFAFPVLSGDHSSLMRPGQHIHYTLTPLVFPVQSF